MMRSITHEMDDLAEGILTEERKIAKKTLDLLDKLFIKDDLIYESRTFFDWMLAMTPKERNTIGELLKYDTVFREGSDFTQ